MKTTTGVLGSWSPGIRGGGTWRSAILVVIVGLACACGGSEPAPSASPAHSHTAPHGGTLVELGEHFAQLEFVLDRQAGSLTLYVLDGEAAQAVRVAHPSLTFTVPTADGQGRRPIVLNAKANTLTGETVGDTSEFTGSSELLAGKTTVTGQLGSITVKGQTFREIAVTIGG